MTRVLFAGHLPACAESLRAVTSRALLDTRSSVRTEDFSEREAIRQVQAGSKLVLVYDAAELVVGVLLGAGKVDALPRVADLLQTWCDSAQAMLRLASKYPEQCLLVNGAAAVAHPERFLAEADRGLGLACGPLDAAAPSPAVFTGLTVVVRALADATVAAHANAGELFIELDSCAHIGSDPTASKPVSFDAAWSDLAASESERLAARDEVDALVADVAHAREALDQCEGARSRTERRLESVTRDRDRHAAMAVKAARDLESNATAAAEAAASADRLQQEGDTLLAQLHEAHLESEAFFDRATELSGEADALKNQKSVLEKSLTTRASELDACKGERDRARHTAAQQSTELARMEAAALQDHQLLGDARTALAQLRSFWQSHQPAEVVIDLRREVAGANWHAAEADGRWTGPETSSTLTLPALAAGRYRVELTLLGAMTAEIGAGLQLALNDRPLAVVFNRAKHPRTATATLEVNDSQAGEWQLTIAVPAVASPADRGAADSRRLGVRVGEVKFIALSGG